MGPRALLNVEDRKQITVACTLFAFRTSNSSCIAAQMTIAFDQRVA
jgi:hypothetical protein